MARHLFLVEIFKIYLFPMCITILAYRPYGVIGFKT